MASLPILTLIGKRTGNRLARARIGVDGDDNDNEDSRTPARVDQSPQDSQRPGLERGRMDSWEAPFDADGGHGFRGSTPLIRSR